MNDFGFGDLLGGGVDCGPDVGCISNGGGIIEKLCYSVF